jgi:hypothetical protein
MGSLRFPEGVVQPFALQWQDYSHFSVAFEKWLIYTLDSAPREAEELYREGSSTSGVAGGV